MLALGFDSNPDLPRFIHRGLILWQQLTVSYLLVVLWHCLPLGRVPMSRFYAVMSSMDAGGPFRCDEGSVIGGVKGSDGDSMEVELFEGGDDKQPRHADDHHHSSTCSLMEFR